MPAGLARRRNLRQREEACLARPNPQRNPLNPLSVVVLVPLDLLLLPLEQGLAHLASNNSNSNRSSNSSRLGPVLVRSVRLSHNNQPGSGLADSVPHSRSSSKPVVFSAQATLLSVKSPPLADSVRVSHFNIVFAIDTLKALQLQALALLGPVPELLVRRSPRPPPTPLVRLLNNPRQVRLAPEDSEPVSSRLRFLFISLTLLFIAANKSIFGQPTTGAFGSTTTGTGTGIFGQQPQQQQPAQPTTGLFGNTTAGTTGTGLFGQQQQPQQTTGREYTDASLSGSFSLSPSLR